MGKGLPHRKANIKVPPITNPNGDAMPRRSKEKSGLEISFEIGQVILFF
jgi:hypothetical protein